MIGLINPAWKNKLINCTATTFQRPETMGFACALPFGFLLLLTGWSFFLLKGGPSSFAQQGIRR
jgi:hypothetical protein